jgi:hypothetical protein
LLFLNNKITKMNRVRLLIFPSGKCHKSYGKFVSWSFLSNILVSAESVLSTHAMLNAISSENTETVRTVNYIGKDIIGQLGSLGYMAKMANKADKSPKKFLRHSTIIQQTSFLTMCLTPFCPSYFLYVAGTANAASNIAFTGFGAINAKCIQKLAIDDNIGELYAKITVLNTIGSSVGLILGLGLIQVIKEPSMTFLFIPVVGGLRYFTFKKAVEDLL